MKKEIDPKLQPSFPFIDPETDKNKNPNPQEQINKTIKNALIPKNESVETEEKNSEISKKAKRINEIITIINRLSEDEKKNLFLCPKDTPIERTSGRMVYAENPILIIRIANKKVKGYSAFKIADKVPVVYSTYGFQDRNYFRLHQNDKIGVQTSKTFYRPKRITLNNLDKILNS